MDSLQYDGCELSFSSDSDCTNYENVNELDLQPCLICNRTFLPKALEKHMGICEKMNFKKRKPFDSCRQRLEGTDQANYIPPNNSTFKHDAKMLKSNTFTAGVIKHRTPLNQIDFERKNERPSMVQDNSVVKHAKRTILAPVSELCPFCDRSFGIKAYDRHVEWCKEKSRLKNPGITKQLSMAKERLEARTKYRAPNVNRSKREKNREKYSGMSDSVTSLTESLSYYPYSRERKNSNTSISMASSYTSDGIYLDKYDPFLSAKRQFEDLFSPSIQMTTSVPEKTTITIKSPSSVKSSNLRSPTAISATSKEQKSNFRRSSSLRAPKRNPTPLHHPITKYNSTIQRGISDEGPISSNFMKPEEYDELPVKSHAIITPDLVPRSLSRDNFNRSPSRDSARKSSSRDSSLALSSHERTPELVNRDPKSIINRRQIQWENKHLNTSLDYPLAKTDSLAAFLMYENGLTVEEENNNETVEQKENKKLLGEKEQNCVGTEKAIKPIETQPDIILPPNHQLFRAENRIKSASTHQEPSNPLRNSLELFHIDHSSLDSKLLNFNDNDTNYDNHIYITSKQNNSESEPSAKTVNTLNKSIEIIIANQFTSLQGNKTEVPIGDISSMEKRSLKRQMKLNKNNFLYDQTTDEPDSQNNSFTEKEKQIDDSVDDKKYKSRTLPPLTLLMEPEPKFATTNIKTEQNDVNIDQLFDNFDFDEFISSFDDDEQYPIFKNYKEIMTKRRSGSLQRSDNSESSAENADNEYFGSLSPPVSPKKQNQIALASINDRLSPITRKISINDLPDPTTTATSTSRIQQKCLPLELEGHFEAPKKVNLPIADQSMSPIELELLKSVYQLNEFCEGNDNLLMDNYNAKSEAENRKIDNAHYESPNKLIPSSIDLSPTLRTNKCSFLLQNLNYQNPEIVDDCNNLTAEQPSADSSLSDPSFFDSPLNNSSIKYSKKPLGRCHSSSASESSLPPIVHKNDSQNIYNMINSNASYLFQKKSNANDVYNDKIRKCETRTPKFCYECGAKYIVAHAKFCMECGVKRVNLDLNN